ncbi:MAG: hypothetical protein H8F28_23350 [Fibrella sp.]|nr:hypothetical protein [Armatimonadota bacterium]
MGEIGGVPPTDPSELAFLGLDTRTPYTAEYSGDDAGTLHGALENTKGQQDPWSETASATIGG